MNHIHEVISVVAYFDPTIREKVRGVIPLKFIWKNRTYKVSEVNFHSTRIMDGVINHVFGVFTGGLVAELHFNTKTLIWTIEQAQDSGDFS